MHDRWTVPIPMQPRCLHEAMLQRRAASASVPEREDRGGCPGLFFSVLLVFTRAARFRTAFITASSDRPWTGIRRRALRSRRSARATPFFMLLLYSCVCILASLRPRRYGSMS